MGQRLAAFRSVVPILVPALIGALPAHARAQAPAAAMGMPPVEAGSPVRPGDSSLRAELVAVDTAAIRDAAAPFTLRVFGDAQFEIVPIRRVILEDGVSLWGSVAGDPFGWAAVTVDGDQITAGIWTSRGAFELAPTGRLDPSGLPICAASQLRAGDVVRCAMAGRPAMPVNGDDGRATPELAGAFARPPAAQPHGVSRGPGEGGLRGVPACECPDDQTTLDVLVVYTSLARTNAGGTAALRSRVTNAFEAANGAFDNSGLSRLSLRRVDFMEIAYAEQSPPPPDWLDHLGRVTETADGFMDSVHAQRDASRADAVMLIVDDPRFTGGAAWWAPYSDAQAFSCLNWRGMGGGSLLAAHEIGHNFGCAHDHATDSTALLSYAFGHVFSAGATTYGTIMSYPGDVHVPYFSTPAILHGSGQPYGVPIGAPGAAYNALVIEQTRRTLTNFRDGDATVDCNGNGLPDSDDIAAGRSADINHNCRPDECEVRLYVDASAPSEGDGLSWSTARKDLGEVLAAASLPCSNVMEIWVADGTYDPGRSGTDRASSFGLRSGMAIYGGFQGRSRPGGGETILSQRDPVSHQTILTGDIGVHADDTDNCYSVVTAINTDSSAMLDGFTIERGYSDWEGAGLYCESASPTVRNCLFRLNRAGGGAGARAGTVSSPTFENCRFEDNTAAFSGGGLSSTDGSHPAVIGCVFESNSASYGGGSFTGYAAQTTFTDCVFRMNSGLSGSGAADGYLDSSINMHGCLLENNTSPEGGGGAIQTGTNVEVTLESCTFRDNSSRDGGGAIRVFSGNLEVRDCDFEGNSSRSGGAIALVDSTCNLDRGRFTGNEASPSVGGALDLYNTDSTVTNSQFTGNSSTDTAGGIWAQAGPATRVINCTIHGNSAGTNGGGVTAFGATLTLANTILWANTSSSAGTQNRQISLFSSTRDVRRCCIQGLNGSLGGVGNTGADPMLALAGTDLAPQPRSACIDAGDNGMVPAGVTTDLAGAPRFVDDPGAPNTGSGGPAVVDIGALERQPPGNACPCDWNNADGLDSQDYFDFVEDFLAGNADFNGVDGTDSQDYFDFIECFFAACS